MNISSNEKILARISQIEKNPLYFTYHSKY